MNRNEESNKNDEKFNKESTYIAYGYNEPVISKIVSHLSNDPVIIRSSHST